MCENPLGGGEWRCRREARPRWRRLWTTRTPRPRPPRRSATPAGAWRRRDVALRSGTGPGHFVGPASRCDLTVCTLHICIQMCRTNRTGGDGVCCRPPRAPAHAAAGLQQFRVDPGLRAVRGPPALRAPHSRRGTPVRRGERGVRLRAAARHSALASSASSSSTRAVSAVSTATVAGDAVLVPRGTAARVSRAVGVAGA